MSRTQITYTVFECPKCGWREAALGVALSCVGDHPGDHGAHRPRHEPVWMKRVGTADSLRG